MSQECNAPTLMDDAAKASYLDGVASSAVTAHVQTCAVCSSELQALAQQTTQLTATMFRANCPSTDDLLHHIHFEADAAIAQHLEGCPHCSAEIATLQAVLASPLDMPGQVPLATPTTSWRDQLQGLGRQLLEAVRLPQPTTPAYALRGEQQLIHYQAGSFLITLTREAPIASAEMWSIEGQVVNQGDADADCQGRVSLLHDNIVVTQQEIDEFGYFDLSEVKTSTYDLQLELPTNIVLITRVQL